MFGYLQCGIDRFGLLWQWVKSTVIVVVLLLVYVAGYYWLVDPVWLLPGNVSRESAPVEAQYRSGGRFAEWFFHPLNAVDRRLRPEWWAGFPATPPWQTEATATCFRNSINPYP